MTAVDRCLPQILPTGRYRLADRRDSQTESVAVATRSNYRWLPGRAPIVEEEQLWIGSHAGDCIGTSRELNRIGNRYPEQISIEGMGDAAFNRAERAGENDIFREADIAPASPDSWYTAAAADPAAAHVTMINVTSSRMVIPSFPGVRLLEVQRGNVAGDKAQGPTVRCQVKLERWARALRRLQSS